MYRQVIDLKKGDLVEHLNGEMFEINSCEVDSNDNRVCNISSTKYGDFQAPSFSYVKILLSLKTNNT